MTIRSTMPVHRRTRRLAQRGPEQRRAGLIAGLLACAICAPSANAECDERDLALRDVPAPVMAAGHGTVAGFSAESAALITGDRGPIYELEGAVGGVPVELRFAADGTLLGIDGDDDSDD
ncbi:MAG: hypothetical protein H6977_09820 [Gammaproteobacteria bacterium]|nr:hypothetical protein [Gammaproteobacteria bacterium]MCP5200302.1 hypothetical protein [Gammaproteobacteria bacterium]